MYIALSRIHETPWLSSGFADFRAWYENTRCYDVFIPRTKLIAPRPFDSGSKTI